MEEAFASAATKFDDFDAFFDRGVGLDALSRLLADEMQSDLQSTPIQELLAFALRRCGPAYGAWKKTSKKLPEGATARLVENDLAWASIDAYPDWVVGFAKEFLSSAHHAALLLQLAWRKDNRVFGFVQAARKRRKLSRWSFEHDLLDEPLVSASLKYDGTCFGRLSCGMLLGRRLVAKSGTYCHTSTSAAEACDVARFREALCRVAGDELGRVALYGELMCNPHFYDYGKKGLHSKWICFGAVVEILPDTHIHIIANNLGRSGLANSIGDGKIRLFLCEAFRTLLCASCPMCQLVDEARSCELTHFSLVNQLAPSLVAGEHEGVVVVFRRGRHDVSIRKWKNSAEGGDVSQRHAERLRATLLELVALEKLNLLDQRVVDMVTTMLSVATARTCKIQEKKQKVMAR